MDPNETLKLIRDRCKAILASEESSDPAYFLAEDIDNLDTWLSRGGFLPADWNLACQL